MVKRNDACYAVLLYAAISRHVTPLSNGDLMYAHGRQSLWPVGRPSPQNSINCAQQYNAKKGQHARNNKLSVLEQTFTNNALPNSVNLMKITHGTSIIDLDTDARI
jgi:hypothetical protein